MRTTRPERRWAAFACLAVAIVLGAAGCGGDESQDEPAAGADCENLNTVRITLPLDALNFTALYVARSEGFFSKRCLNVDSIQTSGGGPDIAAVIAGRAQFNFAGNSSLTNSIPEDQPVVGIMQSLHRVAFSVFIRKETARELGVEPEMPLEEKLAALAKMKGELRWGVSRPGAFSDGIARYYIRKAGLEAGKDVKIVAVGTGASALAAMSAGSLDIHGDAAPVPEESVVQDIGEIFIDMAEEDPVFSDFAMQSLVVRRDYAEENPEVVKDVLGALLEANTWVVEHEPEEIAKVLGDYFPNVDPEALTLAAEKVQSLHSPDGCYTQSSWQNLNDVFVESGSLEAAIPFEEAVTNKYLPQADQCEA